MWRQPGRLWTGSRPRACGCNICRNGPQVHLWGKSFDTEQGEPEFSGVLRATPAPGQSTYHLIQFIGPVRDEWVNRIKTAGVQIVDYVPNYTYVVRATPDQIQRLQNRPEIQWTGLYHPGYRLAPPALQSLLSPRETDPAGEYVVEFYADQFPSDMQALLDIAGLTGSEIIPVGGYSDGQSRHRMTVQGQLSRIISLVADTGFSYLSPEVRLQLFNDAARTAVGSGRAHEHQLTGAGQVLAVTDSGVDTDHEMFAMRANREATATPGSSYPLPSGARFRPTRR